MQQEGDGITDMTKMETESAKKHQTLILLQITQTKYSQREMCDQKSSNLLFFSRLHVYKEEKKKTKRSVLTS